MKFWAFLKTKQYCISLHLVVQLDLIGSCRRSYYQG
jgi:hypothetical protein